MRYAALFIGCLAAAPALAWEEASITLPGASVPVRIEHLSSISRRSSEGVMAKAHLSSPFGTGWVPYVGAGATREAALENPGEETTRYQFAAGAAYMLPVSGMLTSSNLTFGYHYSGAPNDATGLASTTAPGTLRRVDPSHAVEANWRLTF